jgi:DNA-binding NarL/FixJ family response regulator
MLAGVMERWTDAERHFVSALEMNARQDARPWLVHTQHQFATMLLARGRAEDRARAAGLLDEAAAVGQVLGMKALAARCTALRERAQPQSGKDAYPAGLSRREVEVLRLVAAGKGNREIAERLFVSPNTVANHVRSILTKTHTANRTEAAAFALRQALLDKEPAVVTRTPPGGAGSPR